MIILGLTGSIAMGKSTVASMFEDAGIPVHDSDAAVHRLMRPDGKAYDAIIAAFDDITGPDGQIDRQKLGRAVFADPEQRRRLEAILHPLVRQGRQDWLDQQQAENTGLVVLDIPLLFETESDKDCDAVAVVSATARQQKNRAMARPGMTAEKFAAILSSQMPDHEKRQRADHIIPTSFGETASRWYVNRLIRTLRRKTDTENHA